MERLCDDHGGAALVRAPVQQEQAIRVERRGQEPLPETRGLVHAGLDPIEVRRRISENRKERGPWELTNSCEPTRPKIDARLKPYQQIFGEPNVRITKWQRVSE